MTIKVFVAAITFIFLLGNNECNAGVFSNQAKLLSEICGLKLAPIQAIEEIPIGEEIRTYEWKHLNHAEARTLFNDSNFQPQVRRSGAFESKGSYRDGGYKVIEQGIRVIMPTGAVFSRIVDDPLFGQIGISWLDETSGLIWSSALPKTMQKQEADIKSKEIAKRVLPYLEEFQKLFDHLGVDKKGNVNSLFDLAIIGGYWASNKKTDDGGYRFGSEIIRDNLISWPDNYPFFREIFLSDSWDYSSFTRSVRLVRSK